MEWEEHSSKQVNYASVGLDMRRVPKLKGHEGVLLQTLDMCHLVSSGFKESGETTPELLDENCLDS